MEPTRSTLSRSTLSKLRSRRPNTQDSINLKDIVYLFVFPYLFFLLSFSFLSAPVHLFHSSPIFPVLHPSKLRAYQYTGKSKNYKFLEFFKNLLCHKQTDFRIFVIFFFFFFFFFFCGLPTPLHPDRITTHGQLTTYLLIYLQVYYAFLISYYIYNSDNTCNRKVTLIILY